MGCGFGTRPTRLIRQLTCKSLARQLRLVGPGGRTAFPDFATCAGKRTRPSSNPDARRSLLPDAHPAATALTAIRPRLARGSNSEGELLPPSKESDLVNVVMGLQRSIAKPAVGVDQSTPCSQSVDQPPLPMHPDRFRPPRPFLRVDPVPALPWLAAVCPARTTPSDSSLSPRPALALRH